MHLQNRTEVFTLGHSPDPDDAFMFYAIAKNKIDLRGYRFEHRLEDIQTLNERGRQGDLHISAISIHAYAYMADKYALLPCGASMGDGYGPVIVRKRSERPTSNEESMDYSGAREFLNSKKIAVPGKMTSAFLALQLFLGEFEFTVVPFDKIFVEYGLTHRDEAVAYSLADARDMNAQLASKFIGMYVNEFTRDYGEIGRAAIRKFLSDAHYKGYIDAPIKLEFVE